MVRKLKPCGTEAAYKRHVRLQKKLEAAGDPEGAAAAAPCEPCKKAHSRSVVAAKRKTWAPRALRPCGTEAAYQRHIARGEPTDFKCRLAHANYVRPYYRARKQRQAA